MFDSERAQQRLVKSLVAVLQALRIDVRSFNMAQLTELVRQVKKHSPADLSLFYKYVDSNAAGWKLEDSFVEVCQLITIFAEAGLNLESSKLVAAQTELIQDRLLKNKDIPAEQMIDLLWSQIYLSRVASTFSPFQTKLFFMLERFERETALTNSELLKLHQINLFIQNACDAGYLPPALKHVIPKKVQNRAAKEYHHHDLETSSYPELQEEIARKLLKLRVTFSENELCSAKVPGYNANFKLGDEFKDILIQVRGDNNCCAVTRDWDGLSSNKETYLELLRTAKVKLPNGELRSKFLIHTIESKHWEGLSEKEKMALLYEMTHDGRVKLQTHIKGAF